MNQKSRSPLKKIKVIRVKTIMKELCDECGSFFLLLLKMQNLIIDGKRIKAFHPKRNYEK